MYVVVLGLVGYGDGGGRGSNICGSERVSWLAMMELKMVMLTIGMKTADRMFLLRIYSLQNSITLCPATKKTKFHISTIFYKRCLSATIGI